MNGPDPTVTLFDSSYLENKKRWKLKKKGSEDVYKLRLLKFPNQTTDSSDHEFYSIRPKF